MSQLITLGRVRLVGSDGVESAAAQPKRMALLAYLALVSVKGAARRDALLALFWPELGDEEGRRALRQGLHYLRRTLGEDVFVGEGDELRVREQTLGCDAVEFEKLIELGHAEQALALYRGDFLDGFHVDDVASEYEEWVERTRARLRRRASAGAWSASDSAEREGDTSRALELARRACELEPDQEGGWRRLMTLHERVGDRAGALRAYDEIAARLEREFDARPAPETSALAESIRTSTRAVAVPAPSIEAAPAEIPPAVPRVESVPEPDSHPHSHTDSSSHSGTRAPVVRRSSALIALALGVVLVGGAAFYFGTRDARAEPSLLGTGTLSRRDRLLVADFADLASDSILAAAVTEVLRIDLTQSPFVTVLTPRQVRTTLTRMERAPDVAVDDSVAREVALRMGVKAFVTGSVAKVAGAYTVSVQLVAAQSGEPLAAYRETADDSTQLIAAVDRASKRMRHRIGESLRTLRDMPAAEHRDERVAGRVAEVHGSAAAHARRQAIRGDRALRAGARDRLRVCRRLVGARDGVRLDRQSRTLYARRARQAMQHKDRLPFTDRSFIEAANAHGRGDYDTAIEVYRRFLDRYPDSYRALNNLAIVHQDRREFADGGEPVHAGDARRLDDREPLLRDRGKPAAAGEVHRGAPHARSRGAPVPGQPSPAQHRGAARIGAAPLGGSGAASRGARRRLGGRHPGAGRSVRGARADGVDTGPAGGVGAAVAHAPAAQRRVGLDGTPSVRRRSTRGDRPALPQPARRAPSRSSIRHWPVLRLTVSSRLIGRMTSSRASTRSPAGSTERDSSPPRPTRTTARSSASRSPSVDGRAA